MFPKKLLQIALIAFGVVFCLVYPIRDRMAVRLGLA